MKPTNLSTIQNSLGETIDPKVYLVTLKQPFYLPKLQVVKEFKCRFFMSTQGRFCFQPLKLKRSGFPVMLYLAEKVESVHELEVKETKKEYDVLQNARTLLKKIHPNAWMELRERLQKAVNENNPELLKTEYMIQGKVKYRNIIKDIEKYESRGMAQHYTERLKDAFDNKKELTWSHETYRHTGRDLSLSVKPQDDGTVNAWFSSEFMRCGNGDYYLLINPTTAIFCERD